MRQFFSGKNGNIFDLGPRRARRARVRGFSSAANRTLFESFLQKKRHRP